MNDTELLRYDRYASNIGGGIDIVLISIFIYFNFIMKIYQQALQLKERKRGFHLITSEITLALPQISDLAVGICQVFIQHTSASLTINENADPTVRKDFETYFNKAVRENDPDYEHDDEGPDDMPAHLKAALLGSSVTIPIRNGRLALGMWQGIYLCEHRDNAMPRKIVVTAWGSDDQSIG
jgi:secondary thiamine-phosphate synthase enzyme